MFGQGNVLYRYLFLADMDAAILPINAGLAFDTLRQLQVHQATAEGSLCKRSIFLLVSNPTLLA